MGRKPIAIGLCLSLAFNSAIAGAFAAERFMLPADSVKGASARFGVWMGFLHETPELSKHFSFSQFQLAVLAGVLINSERTPKDICDLSLEDQVAMIPELIRPLVELSGSKKPIPTDPELIEDLHFIINAVPEDLRSSINESHQRIEAALRELRPIPKIPQTISIRLPSGSDLTVKILAHEKD